MSKLSPLIQSISPVQRSSPQFSPQFSPGIRDDPEVRVKYLSLTISINYSSLYACEDFSWLLIESGVLMVWHHNTCPSLKSLS